MEGKVIYSKEHVFANMMIGFYIKIRNDIFLIPTVRIDLEKDGNNWIYGFNLIFLQMSIMLYYQTSNK